MKATVIVTLKKGVLDPQGKTIHKAVESMGHRGILEIRQGKYFEVQLGEEISKDLARQLLETIAREVLANPVIEDYRVELE